MSEIESTAPPKNAAAEASSAHSRVNIPLNLDNWRALPQAVQDSLLWFHQHLLDQKLDWDDACDALGYDRSTVFRVLKGTYEGSWANVVAALLSYKKVAETRGTIQANEFVENGIYKLVAGALEYALANNSVTTITGESRMGKSVACRHWRDLNNHGRSVLVTCPPQGGAAMFLRRVAECVGVNRGRNITDLYEAVCRSFNRHRILIVDEAHRMVPQDRRTRPILLEIVRDIHDQTDCALALVATQRFSDELRRSDYQFEQLLGRIGMPVRLHRKIKDADWLPIVRQYVRQPADKLVAVCREIANSPGRLGIMVETLRVASRIAARGKAKLNDEHVWKAIAIRREMMGEVES